MHIHRSNRIDVLVTLLAGVLSEPLSDPLAQEQVVVQSRGMADWLGRQLASQLGVWANAKFPFPRSALEHLMAAEAPQPGAFEWSRAQLQWGIADHLPQRLGDPAFSPLSAYLADDSDGLKRLQLAGVIADRFDQYATYRPDLVMAWEQGVDDGWQATLWRDIAERHGSGHLARRAADFISRWSTLQRRPASAPERLCIFGIPTLPPQYIVVLDAIARLVEVHLFLLVPTKSWFADLHTERAISRATRDSGLSADELHLELGHPILVANGRVGAQFQQVITEHAHVERDPFIGLKPPGTECALHILQDDIFHLRTRPDSAPPLALPPDDGSIAIHVCHSPMREVEVLRDRLQAMFDENDDLLPEDVVVLTPDLEKYAPYVDAVFGVDVGGAHHLPYRIADRTIRADSATVDAFLGILDLLDSRMKAPEVLDRLATPPVAAKFGVDAEDMEVLSRWVGESGIAWGVDAAHRHEVDQPGHDRNTWAFGLRRMLLGFAMAGDDERLFGGALPYDEIEGDAARKLARLLAFTDALFAHRQVTRASLPLAEWSDRLLRVLEDTIATDDDNEWEVQRLRDTLVTLSSDAAAAGFTAPIPLAAIRWTLADRFERERTGWGFAAGGITIGALLPMRSIPFRVVCLLGLDDGAFPRTTRAPAFDLISSAPRAGDRVPRHEDRYLFLEAILSARDRLVITYTGRSIRDNSELPPSVVVSELRDWLDRSFVTAGDPSEAVTVHHPLQPFHPRQFSQTDPRSYSYAPAFARGAEALAAPQRPPRGPFLVDTLDVSVEERRELTLGDLEQFLANPARTLLAGRLGLFLGPEKPILRDREPLVPDHLERYKLAEPLLQKALAGTVPTHLWPALEASGHFPPGVAGRCVFDELNPIVQQVAAAAGRFTHSTRLPPVQVDLDVPLRVGTTRLVGWLDGLWKDAQLEVHYARLRKKHELAAWVRHLALCVTRGPEHPDTTVLVARHERRPDPTVVQFAPLDPEQAMRHLSVLTRMYWWSQTRAIPFFPENTARYLDERARNRRWTEEKLLTRARERFHSKWISDGLIDPYVRRLFTGLSPFEPDAGWIVGFSKLAEKVWDPVRSCRRVLL